MKQDKFRRAVKLALLDRGLSITDLAAELGLARTTVSLAINRGLYGPTRERIARRLRLSLN